jgi:hypothetical protein
MNEMLVPLLYVSGGINCAVIFACGAFWQRRVMDRLGGRLKTRLSALQDVQNMERMRLKHDFGRKHEVRENAGPPARVTQGMPARKNTKNRYNPPSK